MIEGCGKVVLIFDNVGVHFGITEGVQVAATVQGIHINHHVCIAMDGGPCVGKHLLGPAT